MMRCCEGCLLLLLGMGGEGCCCWERSRSELGVSRRTMLATPPKQPMREANAHALTLFVCRCVESCEWERRGREWNVGYCGEQRSARRFPAWRRNHLSRRGSGTMASRLEFVDACARSLSLSLAPLWIRSSCHLVSPLLSSRHVFLHVGWRYPQDCLQQGGRCRCIERGTHEQTQIRTERAHPIPRRSVKRAR